MTESDRSMNEVHALLEERRRYETWLSALDARRDSTPAHVFERVQADYRSRLQQVADRLAGHRQTIEDARASVVSRLSLLGAEEQMRRDERAELDLRAHVGELAEHDAASAFGTVDDAIRQLGTEKDALQHRIDELNALLADQSIAGAAPAAPAEAAAAHPASEPAPEPAPSFDEMAFLDAVVGEKPVADSQSRAPESDAVAPETAAPAAGVPAPSAVPAEPPKHVPAYERIVTPDESDAESLLAGLNGGAAREAGNAPLAANVASNTPIVLRTSTGVEQVKTLKCNECGAMNYPTEWYCERCGAELAAL